MCNLLLDRVGQALMRVGVGVQAGFSGDLFKACKSCLLPLLSNVVANSEGNHYCTAHFVWGVSDDGRVRGVDTAALRFASDDDLAASISTLAKRVGSTTH